MKRLNEQDIDYDSPHYYFPHHPVFKLESSTTKMRTVFSGSAVTSSGLSLTIRSDLSSILLRLRCHPYVLTGDIQKMFRQIVVHETDRKFQLIFWRFSMEERVETYQLNTVTYGTCSAPYTAAICLQQLVTEFQNDYPDACQALRDDCYMDDILTGHRTETQLIKIKDQLTMILARAGFEPHKWASNKQTIVRNTDKQTEVKILGLSCNTLKDIFTLNCHVNVDTKTTKRLVLSEVQKIFDPLGLLSPIVIIGKIIMQDICQIP
ncbi:uncharacterized protein LOC129753131 [Uranotaenia lowii]|uniref:uncharacterized protein LOC129753131 n=1 Tax=Uranotaenia lowii TaxID=190385 RepID=UPI0024796441|nr:uncharacterized protein LOC129753131 [Uranotaenia lowii]